jgi:hypothetical protein
MQNCAYFSHIGKAQSTLAYHIVVSNICTFISKKDENFPIMKMGITFLFDCEVHRNKLKKPKIAFNQINKTLWFLVNDLHLIRKKHKIYMLLLS